MNKMIVANLVHRPIRSAISIVAIAVEVTLILIIVGLSLGILEDSKTRQQGIGADIMVQPPGASMIIGASSATASVKIANVVQKVPNVAAVSPVILQMNTSAAIEVIYGIDLDSYQKLGGPFHYLEGGPFQGPNDIIIDDLLARSKNLHAGSTLDLLAQKFRVSGVVEHGRGARKFLPISTLQELIGAQGKASIFYVKLQDAGQLEQTTNAIQKISGMEQYKVRSMRDWISLMTPESLPGFSTFINVVIGVAVIIGFIVIFQAMYTAVMERTREIGILKSLGASKAYIVNVILRETLLLAVVGILLGVGISAMARFGLVARFPTLRIILPGGWMLRATLIALAGAALGAVYPAFKAAQKDPIDALAYE